MTNDERVAAQIIADYDQKLAAEVAAWIALPQSMKDAMIVAISHMQSRGKNAAPGPEFLIRMVQLGLATVLAKAIEREVRPCPTE